MRQLEDPAVDLSAFVRSGQRLEAFEKFAVDREEGGFLVGRLIDGGENPLPRSPFKEGDEEIHRAIDDSPGEIASEDRQEKLTVGEGFSTEPGRSGDSENHDESEEGLAEPSGGIESFANERGHEIFAGCKREIAEAVRRNLDSAFRTVSTGFSRFSPRRRAHSKGKWGRIVGRLMFCGEISEDEG